MANAGLAGKFTRVLQPMIKPAEQNRIRIEQRVTSEVRGANTIAPGNVLPGPGHEILVLAREDAARMLGQGTKAINAALEIRVVPAGDVQRGNADPIERLAQVERGPVLAGLGVIEPIAHILRKSFAAHCRMFTEGQQTGLRREV